MNWLDRLLARFGYWRWPDKSGMRDTDAIARGMRWATFYNEPGGLGDVITTLRRGYFEKAALVKPGDVNALLALSLADRICAEIDGSFRVIVVNGEAELHAKQHADMIAALPEAKRRRL